MENETPKKGMGAPIIVGIVALIIVLAAGGFFILNRSKDNSATTSTETTNSQPTQAMDTTNSEQTMMGSDSANIDSGTSTAVTPDAEGMVQVDGSNFAFMPKEIRVKAGQPVTIKFNNTQGFHDFVIDELNVKTKQIQGGSSEEVTFTPTKKGSFEYYCSVGQHRQMGMVGTLIVE